MKPDSVARFEAMIKRAKEIPYSGRPEHKGLVLKDELIAVIEAGLVPPEAESKKYTIDYDCPAPTKPCGCLVGHKCAGDKKDTIEISRAVAEEWLKDGVVTHADTEGALADEIIKALSEGRNS